MQTVSAMKRESTKRSSETSDFLGGCGGHVRSRIVDISEGTKMPRQKCLRGCNSHVLIKLGASCCVRPAIHAATGSFSRRKYKKLKLCRKLHVYQVSVLKN